MYSKLLWLSLVLVFITCKSEVYELPIPNSKASSWPIVQDEVDFNPELYSQSFHLDQNIANGRIAVKKDGLWGIVDEKNRLYFPFEYDTIVYNASLIALKKDHEYEVYDSSRTLIMSIKGEQLMPVMSNFFACRKNNKIALYNPNGLMIRDYEFDGLSGPVDESYFLGLKNEVWTAYDLIGEPLTAHKSSLKAAQFLNEYKVALKAYGPINIGMNKKQIESVIDFKISKSYGNETCSIYTLGKDFLDVKLMINKSNGEDLLERIYFNAAGIVTKSGVGIGTTEKEVIKAYGAKIETQPNKYTEGAHDLFYVPSDRKDKNYRLNFFSKNGKIETFSVGRLPSIEYVEGCL